MPYSGSIKPYRTILHAGKSELVVERSRFLGFAFPVSTEAEAQGALDALRKQFWDARHICYAFRIQCSGGVSRSSDDGEPSGTAGAPILNALTSGETQDALCAVVRYFGGVLLGTGGLVRAYGKTASLALSDGGLREMRVCERFTVAVPYARYNALEQAMRAYGVPFTAEFGADVCITALPAQTQRDQFCMLAANLTNGEAKVRSEGLCLSGA